MRCRDAMDVSLLSEVGAGSVCRLNYVSRVSTFKGYHIPRPACEGAMMLG
jgi:hypothetical protein